MYHSVPCFHTFIENDRYTCFSCLDILEFRYLFFYLGSFRYTLDTLWLLIWMSRTFRYFLDLYIPVALFKKRKKKKGLWGCQCTPGVYKDLWYRPGFWCLQHQRYCFISWYRMLICNTLTRCPVLVPQVLLGTFGIFLVILVRGVLCLTTLFCDFPGGFTPSFLLFIQGDVNLG